MQLIRTGVTRTVLLIGRYALKVPSLRGVYPGGARGRLASFALGVLANQSEHDWHDYEPWAGHVAPVLHSWLGGLINVYPRCQPAPPGAEPPGAEPPALTPDPGDRKPANLGLLDGRVVWLDYALS